MDGVATGLQEKVKGREGAGRGRSSTAGSKDTLPTKWHSHQGPRCQCLFYRWYAFLYFALKQKYYYFDIANVMTNRLVSY
jgi:hypothetical protein